MKTLLLVVLAIAIQPFSYAQSKNFEYCRETISANKDYAVVTKFTVNHELSDSEIETLKNLFFVKNSIYSVTTNSKRTEVYVYHLSQVHFEDLKILIQSTNIELNFISTEITEFRNTHTANSDIER